MQLLLQDSSFSLSSSHFKEGQWRSRGPAWLFRVTTRIGWEHSSPEAASRCSQPFCHAAAGWPHAGDTAWLQSQLSSPDQS